MLLSLLKISCLFCSCSLNEGHSHRFDNHVNPRFVHFGGVLEECIITNAALKDFSCLIVCLVILEGEIGC